MKCPKCQAENPEGMKFCGGCGTKLERVCPHCNFSNPPQFMFCGECGHELIRPKESPPHAYPKPESYTPKYLAEKILTSRAALEGERKQVTVLFADLKGSTELIAERDPEEARNLLDPVIERMMEAVHHYEGTVTHIMGDGIMALFGAPLANEDHAVRACYAALRMQEAIRRYDEDLRRSHGIEVQIRVGLNSGEVVVGSIGSDLHMEYTAVGHTTHLAARMEQLAAPGSIRISSETQRLAEGFIEVKSLGPVPVKALAEPVEVYEVTGGRPARTRLQAVAARGLTRFVGRNAEVEQLRYALQKAGEGRGQVMAIMGEPGVGKSRLFHEFIYSHRTEGWLILEAASVSYGKATVYFPVMDLLKTYFKIQDRDDYREIRQKVIGKLFALDRTLEPALPAFFALLDVPVEDREWQALDPPQRRQRILDAMKRLLLRESQVQPLLVVFEDLHWIDYETQAILDNLVESLPTARILLLVNYRPEYRHAWGSKTYYTQLRIDPLPSESAEELLDALLGADTSLGPLKRLLIERTEGNPFFLEESVRTLVETKALVGQRGAYGLAKPFEGIQVPATVQTVLAARIDGLIPEEKHLVQTAAVIGKHVPFALLQTIADQPEEALRRGLTHLQAAEFLYETTLFPDLEYTFKHALTYEVAYRSLLQERRRGLHAKIVEAIERLHAERLTEHIERLAHHALRGQQWEKALTYSRQAGARAFARSANREAVVCFEQALEALQHLPECPDMMEQAIDIRFELRSALLPLGEIGKILRYLHEAETLAKNLKDQRRLGWVSTYTTIYFLMHGNTNQALAEGQRAVAIAEEAGDFALRVVAGAYLGSIYSELGNYKQAVELLQKTVDALAGDLICERLGQTALPAVFARARLAVCFAEQGQFAEGLRIGEEALRIAESVDQPYSLIWACLGVGHLNLRSGELQKAISAQKRALELIRVWNIPTYFPWAAAQFGYALTLTGNLSEGMRFLDDALKRAVVTPYMVGHLLWLTCLGEAHLLAGRMEEAAKVAEQALSRCRDCGEKGNMAWAMRLLGEIETHRDPPEAEKAEECYRDSIAIAEELRMRPLIAHCHLGLGKLYKRTEKRDKAQEHLTVATTMFRQMDMRFWLEKAEAEMKELPGRG
jgi:class 3 adenylate cyclase/ribosomal protein L40E